MRSAACWSPQAAPDTGALGFICSASMAGLGLRCRCLCGLAARALPCTRLPCTGKALSDRTP